VPRNPRRGTIYLRKEIALEGVTTGRRSSPAIIALMKMYVNGTAACERRRMEQASRWI